MRRVLVWIILIVMMVWGYNYAIENKSEVMAMAESTSKWLNDFRASLEEQNRYKSSPKLEPKPKGQYGAEAYNRLKPKSNHQPSASTAQNEMKPIEDDIHNTQQAEPQLDAQISTESASISSTETVTHPSANQPLANNHENLEDNVTSLSNEADPTQWVKDVTSQLSPSSWNLLMLYDKLPNSTEFKSTNGSLYSSKKPATTFHYLEGESRVKLLTSMETNVHEIGHGYFRYVLSDYLAKSGKQRNDDYAELLLYLNSYEQFFVSVPNNILFPSRELARVIPAQLNTFRYNIYIEGNSSTQSDGVVGLLNEFFAYYIGSKFCYDMLSAYKSAEGNNAEGFLRWVQHTQSSMSAYYEFDYFIKEYLLYMKQYYPTNYQTLATSVGFKEAYTKVKLVYQKLTVDYAQLVDQQINYFNNSGKAYCYIKNGSLYVGKSKHGSFTGTSIFSADKQILLPILNSNRYDSIAGF